MHDETGGVDLSIEIPDGDYHSCVQCGGRGVLAPSEAWGLKVCQFCRVEAGELRPEEVTEVPVAEKTPGEETWFDRERFGMFVHWGLPAVAGREYTMWFKTPREEYEAQMGAFNPTGFDARKLVRLAKRAGMKYLLLITKHHDGFSMFDTALSDYSIARGPLKRDVTVEIADACRDEGLRLSLYYSLPDWHHADYATKRHPPGCYAAQPVEREDPARWESYLEFMHGQVRELCTNYGPVAQLWFDGEWERSREDWQSDRLVAMVRELQPGVMINNRTRSGGDYTSPETFIPRAPRPNTRWEVIDEINTSWFHNPADTNYKSPEELIEMLSTIVSMGGNLVLDVGPTADGDIQPEFVERLEHIGAWLGEQGGIEALSAKRPRTG